MVVKRIVAHARNAVLDHDLFHVVTVQNPRHIAAVVMVHGACSAQGQYAVDAVQIIADVFAAFSLMVPHARALKRDSVSVAVFLRVASCLSANGNVAQSREFASADSDHAVGYIQRFDGGFVKNVVVEPCHAVRNLDAFQSAAAHEQIALVRFHVLGHLNIAQRRTIIERIGTDRSHAVRYPDAFQRRASRKCVASDCLHTVRYGNLD